MPCQSGFSGSCFRMYCFVHLGREVRESVGDTYMLSYRLGQEIGHWFSLFGFLEEDEEDCIFGWSSAYKISP